MQTTIGNLNAHELAASPTASQLRFARGMDQRPGWEQLRSIEQARRWLCLPRTYPRIQLRGDRAYLRALRAAELTAWESTRTALTERAA